MTFNLEFYTQSTECESRIKTLLDMQEPPSAPITHTISEEAKKEDQRDRKWDIKRE